MAGFDGIAHAGVAIVTCMDSRLDPLAMVGLKPGDAKIFRNPGGRVTAPALEALVLGVHLLNVQRILVIPHTRCAMSGTPSSSCARRSASPPAVDATWQIFSVVDDQIAALERGRAEGPHPPADPRRRSSSAGSCTTSTPGCSTRSSEPAGSRLAAVMTDARSLGCRAWPPGSRWPPGGCTDGAGTPTSDAAGAAPTASAAAVATPADAPEVGRRRSGRARRRRPRTAKQALAALVAAERAIADPATRPKELVRAARVQQLAYRELGAQPGVGRDGAGRRTPVAARRGPRQRRLAPGVPGDAPRCSPTRCPPGGSWRRRPPRSCCATTSAASAPTASAGSTSPPSTSSRPGWAGSAARRSPARRGRCSSCRRRGPGGAAATSRTRPTRSWPPPATSRTTAAPRPARLDDALFRYNNSDHYVRGVTLLAKVMERRPRAFYGYYHWDIYYLTAAATYACRSATTATGRCRSSAGWPRTRRR